MSVKLRRKTPCSSTTITIGAGSATSRVSRRVAGRYLVSLVPGSGYLPASLAADSPAGLMGGLLADAVSLGE